MTFAVVYLVAGYPVVAGKLAASAAAAPSLLPRFAELDRNQDGYVDSSEAAAVPHFAWAFSRADVSGDGRLTPAEFARARAQLGRMP
jgi:hypothetical protein